MTFDRTLTKPEFAFAAVWLGSKPFKLRLWNVLARTMLCFDIYLCNIMTIIAVIAALVIYRAMGRLGINKERSRSKLSRLENDSSAFTFPSGLLFVWNDNLVREADEIPLIA